MQSGPLLHRALAPRAMAGHSNPASVVYEAFTNYSLENSRAVSGSTLLGLIDAARVSLATDLAERNLETLIIITPDPSGQPPPRPRRLS